MCDKILEAGWLAALIVVPLFFDIYTSRVFEPDKLSLLRSLAVLMCGVWIVRQIEVNARKSLHGADDTPRPAPSEILRSAQRDNPLLLPTLLIVVVYLISTLFSVAVFVSIWGSYQRMQGTYTTFSYIVIFLVAAGSLRTRAQFDRAVNTILATALPIALYGIMQHFKFDPLPWAGDVTVRVASNMGNSIFVAAYLILVFPLAFARWMEALMDWSAPDGASTPRRWTWVGLALVALALSIGLWLTDFVLGAAFAVLVFPLAYLFARLAKADPRGSVFLAAYTNILSALFMTIFYSQSRGPWVGLATGLFVFAILYALIRGARRVVLAVMGLGLLGFLVVAVFNLPNSPLEPLKSLPYVGRLGTIFDTADPTGRVRELIWQGDIPLILPHSPLWAPGAGDDLFNAIRPLVGYGPETMYVAFNRFYPPDLAHYESRNASPDRSHNETFDSLVITSLLGFAAYLLLYISVVYFVLKWLGAIATRAERNTFVALWFACGLVSALAFGFLRGWNFVGVALPAGMVVGLLLYLVYVALRRYRQTDNAVDPRRALLLGALLAAVVGHLIEINFGIAIASTRLYFWFYAALIVILGMNRLVEPAAAAVPVSAAPHAEPEEPSRSNARRRRTRRTAEPTRRPASADRDQPVAVLGWTAIVALIMVTLGFEFFTNQSGTASALDALGKSLFTKGGAPSYGVFFLLAITWGLAAVLGLSSLRGRIAFPVGLFAILTVTALMWYALLHLRLLTQPGDQTDSLIALLGLYFVSLFLLVAAIALGMWFDQVPVTVSQWARSPISFAAAAVLIVIVAVMTYATNFSGLAADVLYKVGQNYDNAGAWDKSIVVYQRALSYQPAQDYYALFLGRAYLEYARSQTDATKRLAALNASEQVLLQARQINPLNTDHSANLARLHRTWASLVTDKAQQAAEYQKSIDYYLDAIRLSPNTVYLRDELAQVYFLSGQLDKGYAQLQESIKRDQRYAPTYASLGDYYRSEGDAAKAADNYLAALALDPTTLTNPDNTLQDGPLSVFEQPAIQARAIASYTNLIAQDPGSAAARLSLSEIYQRAGKLDLAKSQLEEAFKRSPNDYLLGLDLVNFLSENGEIDEAVTVMRQVVDLAKAAQSTDLTRFQDFSTQLQNLQSRIQAAAKSPDDPEAQRNLAALWKARGQPQFALPVYQTVARLAPGDYDAQKNVALLALQLNRPDDAQSAIVAAAPLAPENEKAIWQNLQVALNSQKAQQYDQALKAAQAALALAASADKPALQAYVTFLQGASANK
ncbi:MAG: O-antigen ligase family protein [Chloroflexi bacterium]|nr:O-antigen ligase family protein [Chloroflexota bacterium]